MNEIFYIDRQTQKQEQEKVYGRIFLETLYGHIFFSRWISWWLLPLIAKIPLASKLYGAFQKSRISRFKIAPFIRTFHIDTSEFLEPPSSFASFNDFFIRRLRPGVRPVALEPEIAILPADGRYLVFENLKEEDGFWVKGKKFDLVQLLQSEELSERYREGAMMIARLCPTDYHRFHFPLDCTPGPARQINGPLYSVNPMALKRNIKILAENKRVITPLHTTQHGTLLYIEVGATYVGSIHQTYTPNKACRKGEEKGYFSFGGSCILLLFEKGKIQFDADLIASSTQKLETRGLLGQSLGRLL